MAERVAFENERLDMVKIVSLIRTSQNVSVGGSSILAQIKSRHASVRPHKNFNSYVPNVDGGFSCFVVGKKYRQSVRGKKWKKALGITFSPLEDPLR